MRYHRPFDYPADADRALFEFDDTAKKLQIEYVLIEGTCLGFIRENGYIKNDNDIDIGIKCGVKEKENLFKELQKHKFIKNSIPGANANSNAHFLKNNILIDIWFKGRSIKNLYSDSFRKIVYKRREFNVFEKTEEYLVHRYGNWKVPKIRKAV